MAWQLTERGWIVTPWFDASPRAIVTIPEDEPKVTTTIADGYTLEGEWGGGNAGDTGRVERERR